MCNAVMYFVILTQYCDILRLNANNTIFDVRMLTMSYLTL